MGQDFRDVLVDLLSFLVEVLAFPLQVIRCAFVDFAIRTGLDDILVKFGNVRK